uniref:Amino acid transporter transmembrane domain-containing protein n=1 Tax=Glossina palpalis gambiensis TaxID=67801 RepID=A0A1B0BPJ2_9MUSC
TTFDGGTGFSPKVSTLFKILFILPLIGLIFQLLAICDLFIFFDDSVSNPVLEKVPAFDNILVVGSHVVYASEGINLFFPLMAAMKKPEQILRCPVGIATLATFGLVVCGAGANKMYSTSYFIFLRTPTTTLGKVVKIFADVSIFFTYPLQLNATYQYIVDELDMANKGPLLTVGLAMMNPLHFHYFMAILGSLCLTVLTFIVPGLIPFCSKNYGRKKRKAIVAGDAFLLSIATLIGGTTTNAIDWSRAKLRDILLKASSFRLKQNFLNFC